jgi:SH3-like domain-containing protein
MEPSLELCFVRILCVVQRLVAQRAYVCPRFWNGVLFISLTIAMLPWQAATETTTALPSNAPERATGSNQRGIVTLTSNLRVLPSARSEVVAIAKEGTHVQILLETLHWYHVRSQDGVEAWIYKPLVSIEHGPLKAPRAAPAALAQPDPKEILSASTAKPHISAESQPENTPKQSGSGTSSAPPIDEPHIPLEMTGVGWFMATVLSHVRGHGAYVLAALGMVLVLSIVLQLRAARQLRRAMREMGQILDIMEDMYGDGARASDRGAAKNYLTAATSPHQPPRPIIEFSPIEHAVLEALSDQREVQEGELAKIVNEKGFASVLLKAVIGDIVRKTGTVGLPWVEVSYVQGRYSYRLRPEALSNLGQEQSERR